MAKFLFLLIIAGLASGCASGKGRPVIKCSTVNQKTTCKNTYVHGIGLRSVIVDAYMRSGPWSQ